MRRVYTATASASGYAQLRRTCSYCGTDFSYSKKIRTHGRAERLDGHSVAMERAQQRADNAFVLWVGIAETLMQSKRSQATYAVRCPNCGTYVEAALKRHFKRGLLSGIRRKIVFSLCGNLIKTTILGCFTMIVLILPWDFPATAAPAGTNVAIVAALASIPILITLSLIFSMIFQLIALVRIHRLREERLGPLRDLACVWAGNTFSRKFVDEIVRLLQSPPDVAIVTKLLTPGRSTGTTVKLAKTVADRCFKFAVIWPASVLAGGLIGLMIGGSLAIVTAIVRGIPPDFGLPILWSIGICTVSLFVLGHVSLIAEIRAERKKRIAAKRNTETLASIINDGPATGGRCAACRKEVQPHASPTGPLKSKGTSGQVRKVTRVAPDNAFICESCNNLICSVCASTKGQELEVRGFCCKECGHHPLRRVYR